MYTLEILSFMGCEQCHSGVSDLAEITITSWTQLVMHVCHTVV